MTSDFEPPPLDALIAELDQRFAGGVEVVRTNRVRRRITRQLRDLAPDRCALLVGPDARPPAWRSAPRDGSTWGGLARENGTDVAFHLWSPYAAPDPGTTPASFRVVALLGTYNDADFVGWLLDRYLEEGLEVYVLDNYSTDGTREILRCYDRHPGLLGVESWPPEGPSREFSWAEMLARKEALVRDLGADWYVQTDSDERRRAHWTGVSLRDALYAVDQSGFSCVDFTYVNHLPVAGHTPPGGGPPEDLVFVEFGRRPGYFMRVNAFKPPPDGVVDLVSSGGHRAKFDGARCYPLNFRCDHYIVRSQSHGMRKILQERFPRWESDRRERNWHTHYDHVDEVHDFERAPGTLPREDDPAWYPINVARLLTRAGMEPDRDFRLV